MQLLVLWQQILLRKKLTMTIYTEWNFQRPSVIWKLFYDRNVAHASYNTLHKGI